MGGDATEVVRATSVDPHDRTCTIGETEEITAWTRYTFPGRAGAYSDFTWVWTCFHGTDWDEARRQQGVWLFEGKQWNENVNDELGNYDYLIDYVFDRAGNIDVRLGAYGIDATKGVASSTLADPTAAADTAHGTLVAKRLLAVNHDHYMAFRIDMDVDGTENRLV